MFTKATENVQANVDLSKRRVEAYVARFGNRDRVGDRIQQGAFAKSISTGRFARGLVSTKYNHDELIGTPEHAEEDQKGLLMVMRISPTKRGDDVLALMQDGALSTYSFKFTIDPDGREYVNEPTGERTRVLKSLELWEAGPVDPDLACNDSTFTVGFKGAVQDSKALWQIADAMRALASLETDETWAQEMWNSLSEDDKNALRGLLESMPAVSSVVSNILSNGEGKSIVPAPAQIDFGPVIEALKSRYDRIRASHT